jgi:hypothetical protein
MEVSEISENHFLTSLAENGNNCCPACTLALIQTLTTQTIIFVYLNLHLVNMLPLYFWINHRFIPQRPKTLIGFRMGLEVIDCVESSYVDVPD